MSRVTILYNEVTDANDPAASDVLTQRRQIGEALLRLGHEVTSVPCNLDLASVQGAIGRSNPEVVFNLVESLGGTDRMMAAATLLLDAMQLRYTGAETSAILLSGDKLRAKVAMASAGIPTPPWFDFETQSWLPAGELVTQNSTVIVKAIFEHASFEMGNDAVQTYRDPNKLSKVLIERIRSTGRVHLAERFVAGREFNLSLVEMDGAPVVLAPAEIDFRELPPDLPKIVGQRAKWQEDSIEYQLTPRRFDYPPTDDNLIAKLCNLAIQCWRLFNLRGYGRVDFRVDDAGQPFVLEVNANPCLSKDAGFVSAAIESGIEYDDLIQSIVLAAGNTKPTPACHSVPAFSDATGLPAGSN